VFKFEYFCIYFKYTMTVSWCVNSYIKSLNPSILCISQAVYTVGFIDIYEYKWKHQYEWQINRSLYRNHWRIQYHQLKGLLNFSVTGFTCLRDIAILLSFPFLIIHLLTMPFCLIIKTLTVSEYWNDIGISAKTCHLFCHCSINSTEQF
jgi:hypothetical protein